MRRVWIVIAASVLLGGMSQSFAHAFLERAVPPVGGAVHGSPIEVSLSFSEELDPGSSSVRVFDRNGKEVDKGNKWLMRDGDTVVKVSLPPLAPGSYRVRWRAVSVDAHTTEGEHSFEVLP